MDSLRSSLLNSSEGASAYNSSPKIQGMYNPMQFVIRLSKEIHDELKDLQRGAYFPNELSPFRIQAYSTFLHENIHWWQHVGSNFGFISSLRFPAQAHVSSSHLKSLLSESGAFKSVLRYDEIYRSQSNNPFINGILNSWHDIEIACNISLAPNLLSKYYGSNKYFLSCEHSYHILWASSIATLAASIDKEFSFLTDVRKWDFSFQQLAKKRMLHNAGQKAWFIWNSSGAIR